MRKYKHLHPMETFDVIAYEQNNRHNLIVIGKDGLFQFDVTDPTKPKELSKLG